MRQLKHQLLILLSFATIGCQQNNNPKKTTETVTENIALPTNSDSLSIDLVALQKEGKLKNTVVVTVNEDPVYHRTKHYNAVALPELLTTHTAIKSLDTEKYQIIFECEDGYKPMMPLQKFLSVKSFIAVSDIDAPKGKLWSKIIKDGQEKKAAPFYLIYEEVSPEDNDFKWPYNIIKIHLVPDSGNISSLFPNEDNKAQVGFELFKKNCITCHAINKIGGTMGPELNYPKSVTEYWKEQQLKDFILDPASFRNGVKMPKIAELNQKEIDEIIIYLHYMREHKSFLTL